MEREISLKWLILILIPFYYIKIPDKIPASIILREKRQRERKENRQKRRMSCREWRDAHRPGLGKTTEREINASSRIIYAFPWYCAFVSY